MNRTNDNGDVTRRITDRPTRRNAVSPALVAVVIFLSLCLGGLATYLIVGRDTKSPIPPDVPLATGKAESTEAIQRVTAEADRPATDRPKPWERLRPGKASCEVWLDPQYGNTYYPSNLLDDNPSTAWAATLNEYLSPDGESFEGPTFKFDTPVKIKRIKIRNGYCKSDKSFYDNARVAEMKIYGNTVDEHGHTDMLLLWSGRLRDSRALQVFDVEAQYAPGQRVTDVFTIMQCRDNGYDYYPGTKYRDICLSDIEFWGN